MKKDLSLGPICSAFLSTEGPGRRLLELKPKGLIFAQGADATSVSYLCSGRAKLSVVTERGKEATIALLTAGDFLGESAVATVGGVHLSTATAITHCVIVRIDRPEMIRVLHLDPVVADLFLQFLLRRGSRIQADFVDQLLQSSERRLARALLLLMEPAGDEEGLLPEITQEVLSDIIGTTRSRVSYFMNRFRERGVIEYNGRIRVHKVLLEEFLRS